MIRSKEARFKGQLGIAMLCLNSTPDHTFIYDAVRVFGKNIEGNKIPNVVRNTQPKSFTLLSPRMLYLGIQIIDRFIE